MRKKTTSLRRHRHDDGGVKFKWVRCSVCGRKMRVAGYAVGGICERCCIMHFERLHQFLSCGERRKSLDNPPLRA